MGWSRWIPKHKLDSVPSHIGAYQLAQTPKPGRTYPVVYIGEGRILERVRYHKRTKRQWSFVKYQVTNSKSRAQQIEAGLLATFKKRFGRLPLYNNKGGKGSSGRGTTSKPWRSVGTRCAKRLGRRYCKNKAAPGYKYCHVHRYASDGSGSAPKSKSSPARRCKAKISGGTRCRRPCQSRRQYCWQH